MQGQRLRKEDDEEDFLLRIAKTPGAYGSANGKDWFCCTPNGPLGNLGNHAVTEHDDGTITVTPSILVTQGGQRGDPSWHGFLQCGVWREC